MVASAAFFTLELRPACLLNKHTLTGREFTTLSFAFLRLNDPGGYKREIAKLEWPKVCGLQNEAQPATRIL